MEIAVVSIEPRLRFALVRAAPKPFDMPEREGRGRSSPDPFSMWDDEGRGEADVLSGRGFESS